MKNTEVKVEDQKIKTDRIKIRKLSKIETTSASSNPSG